MDPVISVCIAVALIIIIGIVIVKGEKEEKKRWKEEERIEKAQSYAEKANEILVDQGFQIDKMIDGLSHRFYVDNASKKWCCINLENISTAKIYAYTDLIRYEYRENNSAVTMGNAVGAAVGGILDGATGAIIGSSGPSETKSVCQTIDVQLYVNDLDTPGITVSFFRPNSREAGLYPNEARQRAQELISTLNFIDANKDKQ